MRPGEELARPGSREVFHLGQVGAGHERALSGACQNCNPQKRVPGEPSECLRKLLLAHYAE